MPFGCVEADNTKHLIIFFLDTKNKMFEMFDYFLKQDTICAKFQ